jgi:hypothetical protein
MLSYITPVFESRKRKNMKTSPKGVAGFWAQDLNSEPPYYYSFDQDIRSKFTTFKIDTVNLPWLDVAENASRDTRIYS